MAQATGTANGALTLTLAAPPAGQHHYITNILITRASAAAIVGNGTLNISTTNLNSATDTTGQCAQGTITMTGISIADETFVVGSQTFTWKASRATVGQVTIGANQAAAVTNIVAALTADIPTVVTAVDGAGDTVVVTAVSGGSAGTALTFTEASTNMAMDGSGTLGGTNESGQLLSWTVGNAIAAGGFLKDVDYNPSCGVLKSAVAATPTTIVCPAPGTGPIWSISVSYFIAP
jgi:hypothetical protein